MARYDAAGATPGSSGKKPPGCAELPAAAGLPPASSQNTSAFVRTRLGANVTQKGGALPVSIRVSAAPDTERANPHPNCTAHAAQRCLTTHRTANSERQRRLGSGQAGKTVDPGGRLEPFIGSLSESQLLISSSMVRGLASGSANLTPSALSASRRDGEDDPWPFDPGQPVGE